MEIQLLTISSDPQPFRKEAENTRTPTSQHWVVVDTETGRRIKYIFRPNGDLLIAPLRISQVANSE